MQQELYQKTIKKKKGRNHADQILKVFLKNGEERWILVHIEVQGKGDNKELSKRMFRYFYRIYDRFDREIYAIALLTDIHEPDRKNQFHYSFYGTELNYTYNIYQFREDEVDQLQASPNSVAVAIIASIYANKTKEDEEQRYDYKRDLITRLLQNMDTHQGYTHTYVSVLIYFMCFLLIKHAPHKTWIYSHLRFFIFVV